MLRFLILIAVLLSPTITLALSTNELFPSLAIKKFDSTTMLDQTSLLHKVTVINFWATWCAACKIELKEMKQTFAPLTAKSNFQFIAVSLDKEPTKAAQWIQDLTGGSQENFLRAGLYIDADLKAAETLGLSSFPMTYIINKLGKVQHIQTGFVEGEGSTEKMAKLVQKLLD